MKIKGLNKFWTDLNKFEETKESNSNECQCKKQNILLSGQRRTECLRDEFSAIMVYELKGGIVFSKLEFLAEVWYIYKLTKRIDLFYTVAVEKKSLLLLQQMLLEPCWREFPGTGIWVDRLANRELNDEEIMWMNVWGVSKGGVG